MVMVDSGAIFGDFKGVYGADEAYLEHSVDL